MDVFIILAPFKSFEGIEKGLYKKDDTKKQKQNAKQIFTLLFCLFNRVKRKRKKLAYLTRLGCTNFTNKSTIDCDNVSEVSLIQTSEGLITDRLSCLFPFIFILT